MTDVSVPTEANAVLRVALSSLRAGPTGVAQHAIDAALSWSALYVPASMRGEGDAIVHNTETGAKTAVAFTEERDSPEWGGYTGLVWRRDPALLVVWRALGIGFEGVLLDPAEGNAGVLLPRAGLRAVVGGRPEQEIREGDNLALRVAIEAFQRGDSPLVRQALVEALANGGALVPAVAGDAEQVAPPYVFRGPEDQNGAGERVLYAFSDRESLSKAPDWAKEAAIILTGPALLEAVVEQGYSALALNLGEGQPLRLPREAIAWLRSRVG